MVTLSLEELALAPARALVRALYLEHLLAFVQRGCDQADFHTAIAPAFAWDLTTYWLPSWWASLTRHGLPAR